MATTISYNNYYGEEINSQQFSLLSDYEIVTKEDGGIKKIEHYSNNKLNFINYYLNSNENVNDLVNSFLQVEITFISTTNFNTYSMELQKTYKNAILLSISNSVFNTAGNEIAMQQVDIATQLPILGSTEKKLFVDNEAVLSFDYNDDGTLNYIWGDWVASIDQWLNGSIYLEDINDYFPNLLTEHPYFINADLLPVP